MQAVHAFENLDDASRGNVQAVRAKFTFFGSLNMRAQFYFHKLQLSRAFTDHVGVMRTLKRAQRRFQHTKQKRPQRKNSVPVILEQEVPETTHIAMIEDDALDSVESQRRPEERGVRTLSMLSSRLPDGDILGRMPRMQTTEECRFEDMLADTFNSIRSRIDGLEEAMGAKHKDFDKKVTYITKLLEHSLSKEALVRAQAEVESQIQAQTIPRFVKRRTRIPTAYTAAPKPVRGPSVSPIDYDET